MRMCLAALDWNNNVNRQQKVSKNGEPLFRIKVDRSGNRTVVTVMEQKDYSWQTEIFDSILAGIKNDEIPKHQVFHL